MQSHVRTYIGASYCRLFNDHQLAPIILLQWVVALALAQDGKTVLAVTHEGVHLLNLQMRTQANFIPNGHKSAISW